MGLFSRIRRLNPLSSFGAIGISAHACHAKHSNLTFRQALELSLVRTRPGWDEARVRRIKSLLDSAETSDEMIQAVIKAESAGL